MKTKKYSIREAKTGESGIELHERSSSSRKDEFGQSLPFARAGEFFGSCASHCSAKCPKRLQNVHEMAHCPSKRAGCLHDAPRTALCQPGDTAFTTVYRRNAELRLNTYAYAGRYPFEQRRNKRRDVI